MHPQRLVAVVVTFNRLEKLQATIARLLAQGDDVLSGCVVFDNGSTDGTQDWLAQQKDPRLAVEISATNLGGAGGFAAAMQAAQAQYDPDWFVLMDDDARPMAETLAQFAAQDRDKADGWAARVVTPDGALCDMNRPWVNPFGSVPALARTLFRGREGFHVADNDTDRRQIDGASFVGLFLSRNAVRTGGFPDADLFLYGDDVLYTLALSRTGLKLLYDPELVFEHDCETLTDGAVLQPLWKVYFYHRNQVFVYRAAAGPFLFWPVLLARWVLWRRRADRYGADRGQYLTLLRLALRDGVTGRKDRNRKDIEALLNDPS